MPFPVLLVLVIYLLLSLVPTDTRTPWDSLLGNMPNLPTQNTTGKDTHAHTKQR